MKAPVIVVHGGAGKIPANHLPDILDGVRKACKKGFEVLESMTALDAVEAAVNVLENNSKFNAGLGSSLTIDGRVEMDSIIISGKDLSSGAVAAVSHVKNPVSLARLVLEKSPHCLMVGNGAEEFAQKHEMKLVSEKSLKSEEALERLMKVTVPKSAEILEPAYDDTVGAVALDRFNNLAVATSTGGISGKLTGRVGCSPIVGCGSWADNDSVAISASGHGESIMKVCLSKHISMMLKDLPLDKAVQESLEMMEKRTNGRGGVIALTRAGDISIFHNSSMMSWAYHTTDGIYSGSSRNAFSQN